MSLFTSFQHFAYREFIDENVEFVVNKSTHFVKKFDWMQIDIIQKKVFHFNVHFSKSILYRWNRKNRIVSFQISFYFIDLNLIDICKILNHVDLKIQIDLNLNFDFHFLRQRRRYCEKREKRRENLKYRIRVATLRKSFWRVI